MVSLGLTIGVLEIGILLATLLYGIATVQAYMYAERRFKDRLWLRIMVVLVWLFETVHTVFTWILLYSLTVTNYGKPETIGDAPWFLALTAPFSSILGGAVQSFFGYRIRVLSGRLIIPLLAWSCAIVRCALGLMFGVEIVRSKTLANFSQHYEHFLTASFILGAAVDGLNTVSLCYYLLRVRSGHKPTRRIVDKLMMYAIETGLLTSLSAIAIVTCLLTVPNTLVAYGIFMFYPKLFSNSFFAALNARQSLRRRRTDTTRLWTISGENQSRPVALEFSQRQSDCSTPVVGTTSGLETETAKETATS